MDPEDRAALVKAAAADLDRAYRDNIQDWLLEQVWTVDEADGQKKRWPDKAYLKDLVQILTSGEKMIAIPKSRRMMVSWAVAAWVTHLARFFPNRAVFWMSENESKAAFVVGRRCAFIEDNIEGPLQKPYRAIRTAHGEIGRMTYGDEAATGSYIWAIPQGADAIRAYTPSVLVIDESEFMDRAHETLAAAMPIVEKGARLVLISTSSGPGGILASICREAGFTRWQ